MDAQLEVVRCRISTDMAGAYSGPAHAASALVRAGGLPALYQGLGPSLAAILPEAAITYGAAPCSPAVHSETSADWPEEVPLHTCPSGASGPPWK